MKMYATSKTTIMITNTSVDDFLPFQDCFDASEIMPDNGSKRKPKLITIPKVFQISGLSNIEKLLVIVMIVTIRNANSATEYKIHGSLYSRGIVLDLTKKTMQV
jgi:hypothetical protein